MRKKMNSILKALTSLVVVAVVCLAILMAGIRVFGFQIYIVLSGSMEPTYMTGSLLYVDDDIDSAQLKEGDVITFQLTEDIIATHRIIEVVKDGDNPDDIKFRTKGDANEVEDGSLVPAENVVGTPVFSVPYLGYLADYIQTPKGMYTAIAAGAALIFIVVIVEVITDEGEEAKKKKEKVKKNGKGELKDEEK